MHCLPPKTQSHLPLWFVVVLALFFAQPVVAADGQLRIDIRDGGNQRPVSDATVRVEARSGEQYQTASDSRGRAELKDLPAGLYEVRVSHPQYQDTRLPSERIVSNKTTVVDVALQTQRRDIEEIVVIGSSNQGTLLNSVGTSTIDREALRSAAGSGSDVLRALDGLPGLFADGEFSSFTVRGSGPRDNLILVDGIPFANVVHFSESFGNQDEEVGGGRYSVFAPNIVASAEFQPGGWDAAYGGRAGSLLKLQVAEGNPDTPSFTTRLDIAGLEVGYDGPSYVHEQSSVLFSARKLNFGRLFETIGINDLGTPQVTDVIFKSQSQLNARNSLEFLTIYAPEEFERDIDNVLASDEDDPGNYDDVQLIQSETDNALFALKWTRLLFDNGELVNQVYLRQYDERSRSGEAYPEQVPQDSAAEAIPRRFPILSSRREEQEIGWRMDMAGDNAWGRLAGGLRITQLDLAFALALDDDWRRFEYDQDDFRPSPQQRYIVLTPQAVNNQYEQRETQYAAYLDQSGSVGDWDWRAGLRYDRDNFSQEDLWSPRLGLTWLGIDALRATATLGRYYQAPRFNDRAADAGNIGLKNESVDQASLGFSYLLREDIELFVEPYYQWLSDLVVAEDGVNQTLSNRGEGRSYGVDTAITRRFDAGWSADIKYSYNQARIRENPQAPSIDAEFSRPHTFSLGGVWEINQRWKLSGRWKWASGRPQDAFIVHEDVLPEGEPLRYSREITAKNVNRYDSFSALNFRADYRRALGGTQIIAFIDVINVLGSSNPNDADFNERTGEIEAEEGSAIPLIGLRLEW